MSTLNVISVTFSFRFFLKTCLLTGPLQQHSSPNLSGVLANLLKNQSP